jgi:hypothetical protein
VDCVRVLGVRLLGSPLEEPHAARHGSLESVGPRGLDSQLLGGDIVRQPRDITRLQAGSPALQGAPRNLVFLAGCGITDKRRLHEHFRCPLFPVVLAHAHLRRLLARSVASPIIPPVCSSRVAASGLARFRPWSRHSRIWSESTTRSRALGAGVWVWGGVGEEDLLGWGRIWLRLWV